jgi:hypothetical protein
MLKALIEGRASVEEMADLAKGQSRRKRSDLILALEGRMEEHHRFLLATQLRRLEAIEHDIASLDLRIVERLEPYRVQAACALDADPGRRLARRRGDHRRDRRRLERVPERLSLERLGRRLPGNHESAGRQRSGSPPITCSPRASPIMNSEKPIWIKSNRPAPSPT